MEAWELIGQRATQRVIDPNTGKVLMEPGVKIGVDLALELSKLNLAVPLMPDERLRPTGLNALEDGEYLSACGLMEELLSRKEIENVP